MHDPNFSAWLCMTQALLSPYYLKSHATILESNVFLCSTYAHSKKEANERKSYFFSLLRILLLRWFTSKICLEPLTCPEFIQHNVVKWQNPGNLTSLAHSSSKGQSRSITETKQRFKILGKQVRTKLDLADELRYHKQCFQQYILELTWIQESEPNQIQSLLITCKWSLDSLCSLINSNLNFKV